MSCPPPPPRRSQVDQILMATEENHGYETELKEAQGSGVADASGMAYLLPTLCSRASVMRCEQALFRQQAPPQVSRAAGPRVYAGPRSQIRGPNAGIGLDAGNFSAHIISLVNLLHRHTHASRRTATKNSSALTASTPTRPSSPTRVTQTSTTLRES